MVHHRRRGISSLHLLCQIGVMLPVFWGLLFLVHWRAGSFWDLDHERYVMHLVILILALVIGTETAPESIIGRGRFSFFGAHRLALRQVACLAGSFALVMFSTKDVIVSRVFFTSFLLLCYPILLFTNRYLYGWLTRIVYQRSPRQLTLLVGSEEGAEELRGWLKLKEDIGFQIVGLLTFDKTEHSTGNYTLLGHLTDLQKVLAEREVDQVVVTELPYLAHALAEVAEVCERNAVRLLVVTDFDRVFHHSMQYHVDDGRHLLALRREPLENPANRIVKRSLDLVLGSIFSVVVLLPLVAVVWIAQRCFSPGDLIFRQKRAGLRNVPFEILKFRTMHSGHCSDEKQATASDDRVFRGARWLRRTGLDEVPQFLNVLRGEMSLVGPRPHLIEHNNLFARVLENYHVRNLVKPGMTGLAQVRGFRGEVHDENDVRQRILSDIAYIETWSLGMDLMIITRTAGQLIIPHRNAY